MAKGNTYRDGMPMSVDRNGIDVKEAAAHPQHYPKTYHEEWVDSVTGECVEPPDWAEPVILRKR